MWDVLYKVVHAWVRRTGPHPGRGYLIKLAAWLKNGECIHELAPGVKVYLNLYREDHVAYWTDRYEENGEVSVFAQLIQPGMTIVDVGANIGMYSLIAAQKVGKQGRVLAFEPVPEIHERLRRNIELNNAANVTPFCIAISNCQGSMQFYVGRNDSVGSLYRQLGEGVIQVNTATLDDVLQEQGVDRVDMVKLDAEGAEYRIIEGMDRLLRRADRPVLLVEHNFTALKAAGSSADQLFNRIVGYGYEAYLVHKGQLEKRSTLGPPAKGVPEEYSSLLFLPNVQEANT